MIAVSGALAAFTAIGALQGLAGWAATARFARTLPADTDQALPPVTVLKPLHGNEPLLAEALATLCEQDYPPGFQIVFGVRDARDTAVPVVEALRARYPAIDISLTIDARQHGTNPKVGNLINMFPAARHDVLIIADSDVHARPDYLRRVAAALARPGAGLATVLYSGLPAFRNTACLLGMTQITHGFLPSTLLARALGRRDCLGATMALTRRTLARIGGLAALKDHLADDNILGQLVRALGLEVALADTIVATTVPERTIAALWRHEMRWARTIRTMAPAGYAASAIQYTMVWALLTVLASSGAPWALGLFGTAWVLRALPVTCIDRALRERLGGLAFRGTLWLLPLRDLLSASVWAVCHLGRRVDWRGQSLEADVPTLDAATGLSEGSHPR